MANEGFGKQLPFSLEAEQSLLGSLLIDPARFADISAIVKADEFYLPEHKEIYVAMQDMFLQSRNIDVVTLMDMLVHDGTYNGEQSKSYMKTLAEAVPTAANIKDYARIVHDKSLLRALIEACAESTDDAYESAEEAGRIVEAAEARIFALAQGNDTKNFTHIRDVLVSTYEELKLLSTDREAVMGTPTNFEDLDRVLVGMGKNDLILVGARPGMGKTSFALNIATNVAKNTKKTVCIFSLEMSAQQLVSRILSSEAMIDSHNLRTGMLSDEEWTKLANCSSTLSDCEILIDDTSGITVTGMKSKLRRVKNLGLVIVDYLGLMQSDRRIDNRVQEVAEISRGLKLLAKELQAPVIACAQLSRGPESRTDKRPMLSDLRDSGAIEQDADIVMFLYRDEYYKDDPERQNIAEVIIAKNRHGSTGKVEMSWLGQYTKFSSLYEGESQPPN